MRTLLNTEFLVPLQYLRYFLSTEFSLRAQGLSGNNADIGHVAGLKFMQQQSMASMKQQPSPVKSMEAPKIAEAVTEVKALSKLKFVPFVKKVAGPKVQLSGNTGRLPPFDFFTPSSQRRSDVCGVPRAGTIFDFYRTKGRKIELAPLASNECRCSLHDQNLVEVRK